MRQIIQLMDIYTNIERKHGQGVFWDILSRYGKA